MNFRNEPYNARSSREYWHVTRTPDQTLLKGRLGMTMDEAEAVQWPVGQAVASPFQQGTSVRGFGRSPGGFAGARVAGRA